MDDAHRCVRALVLWETDSNRRCFCRLFVDSDGGVPATCAVRLSATALFVVFDVFDGVRSDNGNPRGEQIVNGWFLLAKERRRGCLIKFKHFDWIDRFTNSEPTGTKSIDSKIKAKQ